MDRSRNNPAKTTVAPYSLRGRDRPTVSTPIVWDEAEACRHRAQVIDRGDLLVELDTTRSPLPGDESRVLYARG